MTQNYFLVGVLASVVCLGSGCGMVQKNTIDPVGTVAPDVSQVEPSVVISEKAIPPFGLRFNDEGQADLFDVNNTSTVFFGDLISYMRQTQVIPESFDVTNAGDQTIRQVSIISVFDNKTKVVLQGDPMLDGFNVLRPLWVFDAKTNTLSYLEHINAAGPMGYLQSSIISPNGKKMAMVVDSKQEICDTLQITDFSLDKITEVTVPFRSPQESLCMYDPGSLYRTGNIEWVSDTKIKYSVFGYIDPAEQLKTGAAAPLVETRVFTIR